MKHLLYYDNKYILKQCNEKFDILIIKKNTHEELHLINSSRISFSTNYCPNGCVNTVALSNPLLS